MEARLPIIAALPAIAGVVGIGSSVYSAVNNANATNKAANTQAAAAQQAAATYQPYLQGGQSALAQQMQLLGLGSGAGGQAGAISQLQQSPLYQALYHNGQQSVLANAAATGGLRGGNTEASLYNLGVNTLAQTYQNQFNNLGSITGLGENAAAGVGNNLNAAAAAQAGGILGGANANNQIANTIAGIPSVLGNSSVLNALGLGNTGGIPANAYPGVLSSSPIAAGGQTFAPGTLNVQGLTF